MRLVTKFLLSALSPEQFPVSSAPEFAFLGRSNVGKSSLINSLVGEKAAKVSSSPGRTRAINFFALSDSPNARVPRLLFADLPGYGYAKISRSISAEWPKFINPYLEDRPNLALCICLVDSNIPVQSSDQQLVDALRAMGRPLLVVGTKADRLSGNERTKAQAKLKEGLELSDILLCSSKTGNGLKELWTQILERAAVER
ncbi:MAG: ribosome biogenesis GTP-binding protein YihA/YsxC [Acidobacteriaceae bacterium]